MAAPLVTLPLAALLVAAWAVSPPVTSAVGWLVTRQWVWGLACSLGAIAAMRRWQESRSVASLAAASGLYAAALLWKDVFLPVPAVAFVLASGSIRSRLRDVAALLAVAAVYVVWRTAILGGLGGYGELDLAVPSIALGVARSVPVTFAESLGHSWVWMPLLALAGPWPGLRLAAVWILVVAPLAILFPASPVGALSLRYLFPASLVAFAAIAVVAGRRPWPSALALVALSCGAAIVHGIPRSLTVLDELRSAGEEGRDVVRFLERSDCGEVVLVGLEHTPQWFATAMHRIHRDELDRPFARATIVGGIAARASRALARRERDACGVFAYEGGAFHASEGEIGARVEEWLAARTGPSPALEVEARNGELDLRWTAMPGAERYLLFYGEEPDLYAAALPVAGTFYPARNLTAGEYCFRVAAERAGGEVGALSDEICARIDER